MVCAPVDAIDLYFQQRVDPNVPIETVTHHVPGSITRDLLVGKDLPRVYEFTGDGHLIIKSARPDEHWSVMWEHY